MYWSTLLVSLVQNIDFQVKLWKNFEKFWTFSSKISKKIQKKDYFFVKEIRKVLT